VELEIYLKDRTEVIVAACDRYEDGATSLVLYVGDKVIGRYNRGEVAGFHERPERAKPQGAQPWMR
jgi:hypothetical protein